LQDYFNHFRDAILSCQSTMHLFVIYCMQHLFSFMITFTVCASVCRTKVKVCQVPEIEYNILYVVDYFKRLYLSLLSRWQVHIYY
jgi:hypothetical protein